MTSKEDRWTDTCRDIYIDKIKVMSGESLEAYEKRWFKEHSLSKNPSRDTLDVDKLFGVGKEGAGITCRRCKKKTVVYTLVQLRSADEGMTMCATCTSCGHKWNQNT